MPASNRVIWGAAAAVAALGVVALTWRPAPDALYCIGRPGTLWNGLMPLPDGLTPRCPSSATYRQEVQGGLSRVEQYVARGWQPQVLMAPLRRAGYVLLEDETRGAQQRTRIRRVGVQLGLLHGQVRPQGPQFRLKFLAAQGLHAQRALVPPVRTVTGALDGQQQRPGDVRPQVPPKQRRGGQDRSRGAIQPVSPRTPRRGATLSRPGP